MKRLTGLCLALIIVGAGCRDSGLGGGDEPVAPDAGPGAFPDATVRQPRPDVGPGQMLPAPTLTQVSPASGPETGGTRVTLRGTSFFEPAEVLFNGVPATTVVVLDEVSIAATTPPGAIGPADVEVSTPGGIAQLPAGFRYHLDLRIDSIQPARIPEEGGSRLTIRGKGFDDFTVILFDRKPLNALRVIDAETIEGYAPALTPGRPEVYGFNAEADVRRSDVVSVFATPRVDAIAPGYGPIGGGTPQAVAGDGLEGTEIVEIGTVSGTNLEIHGRGRLSIDAPAVMSEGPQDVRIGHADAETTVEGGYIAYDPTRVGLEIVGVTPNRASSEGGEVITIVGHGMGSDARVSIGGTIATVQQWVDAHAVLAVVPAGLAVGQHDVAVFTRSSTLTAPGALRIYAPIVVASVDPNRGPAAGGTTVAITGTGFVEGVEVRIGDVPLTDLVITPLTLVGKTQGGTHGVYDVTVTSPDTRGVLEDAFTYDQPFAIIRLDPTEGSVAGNTYVTVLGRGFEGDVTVAFDGEAGDNVTVENSAVISVRTKPTGAGWVDVDVTTPRGDFTFRQGYLFYDPTIITGGAWGGPVQGSVNVAVIDIGSGRPLPGFVVQLGVKGDLNYAGITDENGLVTISQPGLRGPQTVTAGANDYEHVTYMDLNARNVTVLTAAYPSSADPDDPISPCPVGQPGPIVRGKIFKFKSSLDPVTMPGWRPRVVITYTWANMFSPNPPMPPTQFAFVFRDGGEYQITPARAGTIAVYAILGDFNEDTQQFIPRKMGIARQVPSAAGQITEDVNISLDIDLTRVTDVCLIDPPNQTGGPTTVAVQPFLNLGSEGVIPFDRTVVQDQTIVTIESLPNLTGASFFYRAGSYTTQPDGSFGIPSSEVIAESADESGNCLNVGPFVSMPQDPDPKPAQIAFDGKFSWNQPGITPDVTTIQAIDFVGVSGCCCVDGNMNGSCEDAEPVMCGGTTLQFRRWSIFGKGGLECYQMPPMPPTVEAYEPARGYFWLVQQGIAPRFNYDEFIYNQFSPFFWESWSVWYSQFVWKEETR